MSLDCFLGKLSKRHHNDNNNSNNSNNTKNNNHSHSHNHHHSHNHSHHRRLFFKHVRKELNQSQADMHEWGYSNIDGPDSWAKYFPEGRGSHQSPIDIDTSASYVRYDGTLTPLLLDYERCKATSIFNTGHSFQVRFDLHAPATLSGGPLLHEKYQLLQFHGHWGSSNRAHGSEHTINGRSFPAEMHYVHFNKKKYKTVEEAVHHPDGLAVLSVFLKVSGSNRRNPELQNLIEDFNLIDYDNHDIPLDFSLHPRDLIPRSFDRYFTYPGSLTTPPLSECVIWILLAEPLEVSDDQLTHFHELHSAADGHLIDHNYRPVMPINDRVVRASFQGYSNSAISNGAPIVD